MSDPLAAQLAVIVTLCLGGALSIYSLMPPRGRRVGAHWREVPKPAGRAKWHLSPPLLVVDTESLGYLTYQEVCHLLAWDADKVIQRVARGERLEVPRLPDHRVERLCTLLLENGDQYDVAGMSEGLQHKFSELLALQFVRMVRWHAERASEHLAEWEGQFYHPRLKRSLYPEPGARAKPPIAGLVGVLTRKDPDVWNSVMHWPMWRLLVWAETTRVQAAFDDRDERRRKAVRNA